MTKNQTQKIKVYDVKSATKLAENRNDLSSVRFKVASTHIGKSTCASPRLPGLFLIVPFETVLVLVFLVLSRKIVDCFLSVGSSLPNV